MYKNSSVIKIVLVFACFVLAGGLFYSFTRAHSTQTDSELDLTVSEYVKAVEDYSTNGLKGMWISYLEYQNIDFSSEDIFTRQIDKIFTDCKKMGLNTVIVHARAFGDAFYKSAIFPYSHIMTGKQGQDPGYDPLEIMVAQAHTTGLRIEAWVNPYRVRLNRNMPRELSPDNPANDESLVINAEGGIYYNPALQQVRELVTDGVAEIVTNYDVDGIHFDDYFYPTTDEKCDIAQYEYYQLLTDEAMTHEQWRRENVNTLIKDIYKKVKAIDPDCVFGISPQGNNYNNYNIQYSDIGLWMSENGYVDYIMPQLYWGNYYRLSNGSDEFAFGNILNTWANMPRSDTVKLYIGLGAYRIGYGDGGQNPQDEWVCGGNLSIMASQIAENPRADGWALYRYDSLFRYGEYKELQQKETENLTVLNTK